MHLRQIFGACTLAAALSAQTATQPLQVTAVRFWSLADVTRVAIETNGDFQYKYDRISNPDRVFFDLKGARPHLGGKGVTVKQVGDKLLKRVRIAENVPGVTRVVLDVENDVEFTASQLGNPDRLMIELRSGKQPAATISQSPKPAENTQGPSADLPVAAAPVLATPPPAAVVAMPTAPPASVTPEIAPALTPTPSPVEKAAAAPNQIANPARKTASDGSRSLTRALGLKINRVVIDPGHGGHDQGTAGTHGLLEKDLVLDVSLRLGKLIEEKMGSEVVYTRSDDTFVPLQERTEIANRKKADLFISIHANSSPVARVTGIETYYLNFTSAPDAMDVATRENASSDKSVYELQDLIQTIAKHDKVEESRSLAGEVQSALQAFEVKSSPTAKDRGIRKAPFVVLIGAQMPSILAEIGFLSNFKEESQLSKPEYRQKLAEALYRGISKYALTLSHYEVTKSASAPSSSGKTDNFEK
jgi:N-acetylmuramoyl-L-alanine amidase